jgi:hypothetical protein
VRHMVVLEVGSPHCCKLCSNTEFIVKQSLVSKDVNMEAEGSMALEASTRKPVKTQKTEKT